MKHYSDETRQKIVRPHIQDGRTLKSLALLNIVGLFAILPITP
ncbi:hypothetical protein Si051_01359 [Streptococcus infantarius subsp. infantarius]|nr:hypothetical protein [Streptococcus infantarius subsp. infantarius]